MNNSIAIYCVNYNSYDELNNYLNSIDNALKSSSIPIKLTVFIGDNSKPKKDHKFKTKSFNVNFMVFEDNKGYLGTVYEMIEIIGIKKIKNFNYHVISNVDITLDVLFFQKLFGMENTEKIAWIAPSIISLKRNVDINPAMIYRPTILKLKLLIFSFKYPIIHYFKQFYGCFKSCFKKRKFTHKIYAGHGSIMIFSKSFFLKSMNFKFQEFLFGEELFFAEQIHELKLNVKYEPSIKVYDIENVSTKKLPSKLKRKFRVDSLKFIFNSFYKKAKY